MATDLHYYRLKTSEEGALQSNFAPGGLSDYLRHPEIIFCSRTSKGSLQGTIQIHGFYLASADFIPVEDESASLTETIEFLDAKSDGEEVSLPKVFLMSKSPAEQGQNGTVPFTAYNFTLFDGAATPKAYHLKHLVADSSYVCRASALEAEIARLDADPDYTWTNTRSITFNFYEDYLKESIKTRYANIQIPGTGLSNVIADSYLPKIAVDSNFDISRMRSRARGNLPSTSQCISPLAANLLGLNVVPVEQLCAVLGYTRKDIKELMTRVKRKQLHFVFIGAGGTCMNTSSWLSQMAHWTNTVGLFEEVTVFEKETAEMSNLFRFPVDPNTIITSSGSKPFKTDIIAPVVSNLTRGRININRTYLPSGGKLTPENIARRHGDIVEELGTSAEGGPEIKTRDGVVLYGAPGLEARECFSKIGNFIAGIHADNGCSLWLNPDMKDISLQVESYGMIQLSTFFMNQLRMAIGLLESLSSTDDLKQEDVNLLSYEFDGTRKSTTDRAYNWIIAPRAELNMQTTAEGTM